MVPLTRAHTVPPNPHTHLETLPPGVSHFETLVTKANSHALPRKLCFGAWEEAQDLVQNLRLQ